MLRFIKQSIRSKLLTVFFLFLTTMIVFSVWYYPSALENSLTQAYLEENQLLSRILSALLVAREDTANLEDLAPFLQDSPIAGIQWVKTDGNILEIGGEGVQFPQQFGREQSVWGKQHWFVRQPAPNGDGYVTMAFSRGRIEQLVSHNRWVALGVNVLIFLLGAGLIFLVTQWIIGPIKKLQEKARAVTEGERDVDFDLHEDDEIGELSRHFQSMMETVNTTLSHLQAEKDSVEQKVVQATQKIRDQKEKLQKEIQNLLKQIEQLARGDLSVTIAGSDIQEIDAIIRALNQAIENFREMISTVRRNYHSVVHRLDSIHTYIESLVKNIQSQSMQASEVAAAVEELSQTISETANNTKYARSSAEQNEQLAHEGEEAVHSTAETIEEIATVVSQAAHTVKSLEDSSKQIGEIIAIINEIADQTNLLALNAAIEAARAGEQGKGFAVVAEEVRQLAEKTGEATQKIEDNIKRVQEETMSAYQAIRQGNLVITEGISKAESASEMLQNIASISRQSRQLVDQIAAITSEQAQAGQQISENVEAISHISKDVSQKIESIATLTRELKQEALEIQGHLDQFRISHSEPTMKNNEFRSTVNYK